MCINFSGNSPALFPKMERQPVGWKVHRLQPLTGPLKGHLSECPDPSSLFPERGSVSWSLQGRYRNSSVQSRDGAGRKPKKTANRSRNYFCVLDSEANFSQQITGASTLRFLNYWRRIRCSVFVTLF